jgi:hypothetical protein
VTTFEKPASPTWDSFGRYQIKGADGSKPTPYTRWTTIAGTCEALWALGRWNGRRQLEGALVRPDLLTAAAGVGFDETDAKVKSDLNRILDELETAGKGKANRNSGIGLHALTERLDRGLEVGPVPPDSAADLKVYEEATAHLEHLLVEQVVVHDGLKVAGTVDRFSKIDGVTTVVDLKTGSIDYGAAKISSQLAGYSRSRLVNLDTGKRSDHDARTDVGLVVWLPQGQAKCELIWVDLDTGWRGVELAMKVRDWRRVKSGDVFRPYQQEDDELAAKIATAGSLEELRELWSAQLKKFTPQHKAAAKEKAAALAAAQ